jgi:hypothetical protein
MIAIETKLSHEENPNIEFYIVIYPLLFIGGVKVK